MSGVQLGDSVVQGGFSLACVALAAVLQSVLLVPFRKQRQYDVGAEHVCFACGCACC